MNVTDPIADLLTRVRNAQKAGLDVIVVPASKMKISIAHILREEGFIKNYKCVRDDKQGILKIALAYDEDRKGAIREITRVSKPSRRHFVGAKDLPYVKSGYGIAILSTSRGIMTDREARKQHVGGEHVCSVF
ncbi:MAG: 30S ribosomal protein S8 [Oligoflexus sp.]